MVWWTPGVLVLVGIVAGIVNTLAGGGSFLTLASMIWLGLPADVANGTNRLGVLAQSGASAAAFRHRGVDGGSGLWAQIGVVSTGAIGGTLGSIFLPVEAFELILGIAMLGMVGVSLARPKRWSETGPPSRWRWPALLGAGLYGGFLQAGVGVLLLPALVVLGGRDPVRANARKAQLVLAFTVPALALFAWFGRVDLLAGLALAAGSAIGGVLGTRIAIGGGARLIRWALILVVALTAVRLFWGVFTGG